MDIFTTPSPTENFVNQSSPDTLQFTTQIKREISELLNDPQIPQSVYHKITTYIAQDNLTAPIDFTSEEIQACPQSFKARFMDVISDQYQNINTANLGSNQKSFFELLDPDQRYKPQTEVSITNKNNEKNELQNTYQNSQYALMFMKGLQLASQEIVQYFNEFKEDCIRLILLLIRLAILLKMLSYQDRINGLEKQNYSLEQRISKLEKLL